MARINQLVDGIPSGKISLDGDRFHIGRGADNDLKLSDTTASSRHAVVEKVRPAGSKEAPDYFIQDLGSTNGTFVNGERIERRKLREDDVIRVGMTNFKFSFGSDEDDRDQTKVIHKTWIPGLFYLK